jgi:drug/metabolite transporter (DMT)-like permease
MGRKGLLTTAEGTQQAAFGLEDWGLVLTVSLIWGGSFFFIAYALESFPPAIIGLLRLALGFTVLTFVPGARSVSFDRADRGRVALLGVTWLAGPFLLFPIAEQWISSAVAGMLNGGIPVFAATIAAGMLRRVPTPRQIVGILIGALGIVFISLPSLTGGSRTALGVGLVMLAVLGYALSSNISVPLIQKYGSLATQWRVQGAAVAFSLPYALTQVGKVHNISFTSVGSVVMLGVFGTGLALVLAGRLFARVGVTRGTIFNYLVPVVAILLGVLIRHDPFKPLHAVGIVLVLIGAWTISQATNR